VSGGPRAPVTGHTRVAGVIGDPVRHSLSPAILNAAFAAVGLDWVYVAFPVAAGRAADALAAMRTLDLGGLSVTMPHKAAIAALVDGLSPEAELLGAVNCVAREGDRLVGHNTDGDGFVTAVAAEAGWHPGGRRCVVLGAGGAARAVVAALARSGAAEVVVVNRSPNAARAAIAVAPSCARVGTAADIDGAELVVNATPVGMVGGPDPSGLPVDVGSLGRGHLVVDLVYHPLRTPWLDAAASRGATTLDGIGMLVHQAAMAFHLWTGVEAPIAAMRAAAVAAVGDR